MTDFEYLKKVNQAEAEAYEANERLHRLQLKLSELDADVKSKKDKMNKEIKNQSAKIAEIEDKRDSKLKYNKAILPGSLAKRIILTIVAVIALQVIVYLVTISAMEASTPIKAATSFGLIIAIPVCLICGIVGAVGDYDFNPAGLLLGIFIGGLIGGIMFLLAYLAYTLFDRMGISIIATINIFTILLCGIAALAWYIWYRIKNNRMSENRSNINKTSARDLSEANRTYSFLESNAKTEFQKMDRDITRLKAEINDMKLVVSDKTRTCQLLYNQGILHPDYRNWNCVCIFIKYFEMGLCSSLKGPSGAYSIFRKEYQGDRAIDAINRNAAATEKGVDAINGLSPKLSGIIGMQDAVYSQISAINRKLDKLFKNRSS